MAKRGERPYGRRFGRRGELHAGKTTGHVSARRRRILIPSVSIEPARRTQGEHRRLSSFCDEWLGEKHNEIRESTFVKYSAILEKHIKPALGDCRLPSLTTARVEEFKRELLEEKNLAPKTARDILTVLQSVIRHYAQIFPSSAPSPQFHYPKIRGVEMRVLSTNEQQRLTDALLDSPDAVQIGILLALLTGLRLGELCALRWENISLAERTIRICAAVQRLKSGQKDCAKTRLTLGEPKSDRSWRVIPMSDHMAALCESILRADPAAYFLTGTLRPMEPRTLQYRLKKITRDCEIEGIHFHTLRHTFATRCVEAGFDIKALSEILGHADPSVTLAYYVHSSLDFKRANMDKLSALCPIIIG